MGKGRRRRRAWARPRRPSHVMVRIIISGHAGRKPQKPQPFVLPHASSLVLLRRGVSKKWAMGLSPCPLGPHSLILALRNRNVGRIRLSTTFGGALRSQRKRRFWLSTLVARFMIFRPALGFPSHLSPRPRPAPHTASSHFPTSWLHIHVHGTFVDGGGRPRCV